MNPLAALFLSLPIASLCAGPSSLSPAAPEPQDKKRAGVEPFLPPTIRPTTDDPLLGADGRPLLPGSLPEGVSPEARSAWERLLEGTFADHAGSLDRAPISAFVLSIEARLRNPDGSSNDLSAIYRFLEPSYVRTTLKASKREQLRGPEGDWLIDGKRKTKLVGRDYAEDRRDLDRAAAIAHNFVSLTDPGTKLRIVSLAKLEQPPLNALPPSPSNWPKPRNFASPKELEWIEVTSPDFRLYGPEARPPGSPVPILRVQIGMRPDTNTTALVILREERPEGRESTQLLEFHEIFQLDEFRVPEYIVVYTADAEQPSGFTDKPTADLWVNRRDSRLGAALSPDDFRP